MNQLAAMRPATVFEEDPLQDPSADDRARFLSVAGRRGRYPSTDRLSGSCTADVRRLQRSRFLPEETAEAGIGVAGASSGDLDEKFARAGVAALGC